MVKIIETCMDADGAPNGIFVIGIARGEMFFSNHLIPQGIEGLVEVEGVKDSSSKRITAKADLVLTVEGLHISRNGCKHIRYMRKAREGKPIRVLEAKFWPRLRLALQHVSLSPVHAPGGFGYVLVYKDEIAIPDYSMEGAYGWIILRRDIGDYLAALPPLVDSGVIIFIWIETVGWLNTGERNLSVSNHNPINDSPVEYYDIGRGRPMSSNRRIVRVEYDAGSKIVKNILNEQDGSQYGSTVCQLLPVMRYLEVGKRIPAFCIID